MGRILRNLKRTRKYKYNALNDVALTISKKQSVTPTISRASDNKIQNHIESWETISTDESYLSSNNKENKLKNKILNKIPSSSTDISNTSDETESDDHDRENESNYRRNAPDTSWDHSIETSNISADESGYDKYPVREKQFVSLKKPHVGRQFSSDEETSDDDYDDEMDDSTDMENSNNNDRKNKSKRENDESWSITDTLCCGDYESD